MIVAIILLCFLIIIISHNVNYKSNAKLANGKLLGCQLKRENLENFHIQKIIKSYKLINYIMQIISIIFIIPVLIFINEQMIYFGFFFIWMFLFLFSYFALKNLYMNRLLKEKYNNSFYGKQTFVVSFDFITGRLYSKKNRGYLIFAIPILLNILFILWNLRIYDFQASTIFLLVNLIVPIAIIFVYKYINVHYPAEKKGNTKIIKEKSNIAKQKLFRRYLIFVAVMEIFIANSVSIIIWDDAFNIYIFLVSVCLVSTLLIIFTTKFLLRLYNLNYLTNYYLSNEEPIIDDDIFFMQGFYYNPFNRHQTSYISVKDKMKMYNHASRMGLFYSRLNKIIIFITASLLMILLYSSELAYFNVDLNDNYLKLYSPFYTSIIKIEDIDSVSYEFEEIEKFKINSILNNNVSIGKYYTDKYSLIHTYLYNKQPSNIIIEVSGEYYSFNFTSQEKTFSFYDNLKNLQSMKKETD